MPLYANSNAAALSSQRILNRNYRHLSKSQEKLATGYRINRADDDASGIQISEQMRVQIRGTYKAIENAQDGTNVLNIADGAYETLGNLLQRTRELVVAGASDTYGTDQRNAIKSELDQLSSEMDRLVNTTKFNGKTLLDGSNASYHIQVGANGSNNELLNIASALANNSATSLNVDTANLTVNSYTNAALTLNKIDTAIGTLTSRRATLGAFINRLDSTLNVLSTSVVNQSASEAKIRNADVARESTRLVGSQILVQASASLLTQANQTNTLASQLLQ